MSRSGYGLFHAKNKETKKDDIDPISLEETDPGNKLETITYTRFHVNKNSSRNHLFISPVKTVYWNLDSAKLWFIDHNRNKDPETNLPILSENVLKKRLSNQLNLQKYIQEKNQEPDDLVIKNLFMKYKNDEKMDEEELCFLHNFFHIDNTILMDWKKKCEDSKDYREFANELIQCSDNGSWLVRHTSVKDSDIIKTRAVTYRNYKGDIFHIVIAHIYGYGYTLPNVERGQKMPSIGSNEYILINQQYVFASFIELIKTVSLESDFDLNKLIL